MAQNEEGQNGDAVDASISANLRQARKIIEREYASWITPQRLARRVRLPYFGFEQAYQHAFGMTPQEHLRNVRAREAAHLLAAGHGPESVAQRVGYRRLAVFVGEYRVAFRDDPALLRRLRRWKVQD